MAYYTKNNFLSRFGSTICLILCALILTACGDDESTSTSYSIYGGTIVDYETQPVTWSSRTLIGTADGTAEFDLASVYLSSITDIEIISDGRTYVDAVQNLQNKSTIGYNGDGSWAGFYLDTSNVDSSISTLGLPDDIGAKVRSDGHLILRLNGSSAGSSDIEVSDGDGNDLKVYISSSTSLIPYQGTGAAISNDDIDAIQAILTDIKNGYESENSTLIMSHIKDTISEQTDTDLTNIFSNLSSIDVGLNYDNFTIEGNLPFAKIEPAANYNNIYQISYSSPDGGGSVSSDALNIYFEKIDGVWEIYHIEKAFNFHADLLHALN